MLLCCVGISKRRLLFFFLVLLLDVSSVMGDPDVQAYYFYLERKKNMVCSPFSLRSCSFIMFPACLREKLLSAWKGVANSRLSRGRIWGRASPRSWGGGALGGCRFACEVGKVGAGHPPETAPTQQKWPWYSRRCRNVRGPDACVKCQFCPLTATWC